MPIIVWGPQYSVHHPMIDSQHIRLVELVNELYDALKAGKSKQAVGPILDGLASYTLSHFKMEEDLMKSSGYPEYPGHKKIHDELARQVTDLQTRYRAGEFVTSEVMHFLADWLKHHINEIDKKLGAYLNAKGVGV